jgi:hypothetical protein
MQVNPSGKSELRSGLDPAAVATRRAAQHKQEVYYSRLDNLKTALDKTPAVREEEVVRAKGLVDDPKYPPAEAVRRIANLLAINLSQDRD